MLGGVSIPFIVIFGRGLCIVCGVPATREKKREVNDTRADNRKDLLHLLVDSF